MSSNPYLRADPAIIEFNTPPNELAYIKYEKTPMIKIVKITEFEILN
jgi:hypothetical protein